MRNIFRTSARVFVFVRHVKKSYDFTAKIFHLQNVCSLLHPVIRKIRHAGINLQKQKHPVLTSFIKFLEYFSDNQVTYREKQRKKTKTNNTHENNVFIVIIIVIKKPLVGTLGKDIDALCHPANVAMCRC